MGEVWAVVPARSGSKGLPHKNIRPLAGVPLIGHAIRFAMSSGVCDRVLVSTDSAEYAEIARSLGGWVPFLRDPAAAQDRSMEEDILRDLDAQLDHHGLAKPDALVWLRPTFPFRRKSDLQRALPLLTPEVDSVRLVTDGEPRQYALRDGWLAPSFDDGGRSMLRRQEFEAVYKVFHTDVFWYRNIALGKAFLGRRVIGVPVHKICSIDVDSVEDFEMAEAMIESGSAFLREYTQIETPRQGAA
jgi:CMP-N-acetylneuraminic acid synthetase